jgi:hypothetical protein
MFLIVTFLGLAKVNDASFCDYILLHMDVKVARARS